MSTPALNRTEVTPIPKAPPKPSKGQRRRTNRAVRDENPKCEAGPIITTHDKGHVCFRFSTETHHRRRHNMGGDWLAKVNLIAVCVACHTWIHANETTAEHLELADGRSLYVSAGWDHPERPHEYELLGRITARKVLQLAHRDAPGDTAVAQDYLHRAGFPLTRQNGAA